MREISGTNNYALAASNSVAFALKRNQNRIDSLFRMALSIAGFVFASHSQWWMAGPALMMFASGFSGYCPFYHASGINQKKSFDGFYRTYLPLHNPSPVFVFNADGVVQYKNQPAIELLVDVVALSDLSTYNPEWFAELIKHNRTFDIEYRHNDDVFSVKLCGVAEINCVLAFANNVTSLLAADREIIETQKEIVYAMGAIGETRSRETGNHVLRVAEYSRLLALKSGLSVEQAELLKMASPMHDIGKVGIPDAILNKPGKLTFDEFEVMKTHAMLGYEMLKASERPILKAAATVALEHHEKWNGKGYPRQLRGEDIHIFGRITAVADVFDALGSERIYKKAWSLVDILALLREERGEHFDPQLINLFLNNLPEFIAIRDQYVDRPEGTAALDNPLKLAAGQ